MAAVVNLRADNLNVEPGQTATAELSLANTGSIVEQFTILLLGDVAAWTVVDPPVVSLFPQGQQVVTLRFSPPRQHTTLSGPTEFAVKVIPSNEPDESVVEEGLVTVGSFNDVGAELVPRVTTGRVAGKQRLAVDSRGNVPVPVIVTAVDAAEALKFKIRPSKITTAPGEARFAQVRVTPRKRFWRGTPQQKPYKVQVAPEGEKPLVLDGTLTQKSVLPKWLFPLLGLVALLLLLWFFVLRPIVKSTATTANAAALAAQAAQTRSLASQLAATKTSLAALSGASPATTAAAKPGSPAAPGAPTTVAATSSTATTVASSTTAGKPGGSTTATTQVPPVIGPNDGRINVNSPSGQTNTNQIPVIGPGSSFTVTDLIIENVANTTSGHVFIETLNGTKPPLILMEENLASLTSKEYQFNTPIHLTAGEQLAVALECGGGTTGDNGQPIPGPSCQAGVFFSGPLTQPQPTTTTSIPPG